MSIISADSLRGRLGDPTIRILDVRWWLTDHEKGRRGYETAHIPGATWVDLDTDLVAPGGPGRHPLPDPRAFAARMASLGVGDDTDVVVVDDANGTIAARLWWMLDDLGHRHASVLDGGMAAWLAAGGQVTTEVPAPPPSPAQLNLRDTWTRRIDRAGVIGLLGHATVLDARAFERYRGDLEPVDAKPGHIPTAVSRPVAASFGPDGRMLEPALLRRSFDGVGATVISTCGSGVTACYNALAMRVSGLPDPLVYEGSYSDWAGSGMPVATGDEPGTWPLAEATPDD
jgi:thiosulfate/3-mercaptopyruvate sulfurtransferase